MPETLLEVVALDSFYGDFQALFGVSFALTDGAVLAIIGANGAGKSTLLKTIAGLMKARAEAIRFAGAPIGGLAAHKVVARGIALIPEGRRLFPSLSVEENLLVGGQVKRPGRWNLARIYEVFPMLRERRNAPATALSGGQQQMVAIGRALMSNPRLLLCDEISLGLAPAIVRDIYARLPQITENGCGMVIVEQDIGQAMAASGQVICLQEGRVALQGATGAVTREQIAAAYFGV